MTFAAPILLIGLIAAGIPFLLHLISRVRAREEQFPTLRFLRTSMQKNARRRRLRNWLLLLLRSMLLAVLAMAVAEPVSRVTGGWLGGNGQAAVLVLDDSYSMATSDAKNSPRRFARAKADASALLGGEDKPALVSLITTTGQTATGPLSGQLDMVRKSVATAKLRFGRSSLAQRFAQAVDMLSRQNNPRRAIYIFSDLQRLSFEPLGKLVGLARAKNIHVFIVNYARPTVSNVGITELAVQGKAIVDGQVKFVATIKNSSPAPRRVEVLFRMDDQPDRGAQARRVIKNLAPAGQPGETAQVKFGHQFARAGQVSGEIRLRQNDDLPVDNIRRFCLEVRPRVRVLVVSGGEKNEKNEKNTGYAFQPGTMLELALDWRDAARQQSPWPIQLGTTSAGDFTPASLKNIDAVFFCGVSTFDAATAKAVGEFVRRGGEAVFFLGPGVRATDYNQRFGRGEADLLPAAIGQAGGQVGPGAEANAVESMDIAHPLLAGLFDERADYPAVLVQRYFPFKKFSSSSSRVLMELTGGDPLLVERRVGAGRVLWCATSASPRWSNLPMASVFPPMMIRLALRAGASVSLGEMYIANQPVKLHVAGAGKAGGAKNIRVTLPQSVGNDERVKKLPIRQAGDVRFTDTGELGLYRWDFFNFSNFFNNNDSDADKDDASQTGRFVVNPYGPESDLSTYQPDELRDALKNSGLERVYIGSSLEAVQSAAAKDAQGRNWWDVLIVAVIFLLLVEAVLANRLKGHEKR